MDKVIIDKIDVSDYANYWFDRCCEINRERSKYLQALQEIREIFSHLDENNWFHTGKHIYMDDRCINEIKTRILDKINEVIGAE